MKKQLITGIIAVMLAVVFGAMTANAASVAAQITRIKGAVMVKTSPSADWIAASEGMKVTEGASVKCGPGAEAFVVWKTNAVKIASGSIVDIDNLMEDSAGNSKTQFNIKEGSVFAKAGKLSGKSSFMVKTPTAVAGVRGTGFEAGIGRFAVVDGSINVNAGGVDVEVKVGMLVEISAEGVPSVPVSIPPVMLQTLQTTNTECAAVVVETVSAAGGETAKPTSSESTAEPTSTENADAALDSTDQVINTVDVTDTTEQATEAVNQFLPGNGGLNGTINIQMQP